MKRMLGVLFAVALVCIFSPTAYAATCGDDGLVAYWPFNGNSSDESGCDQNVSAPSSTLGGPTLCEDRLGNPDSAYCFDGIDDYFTRMNEDDYPISITGPISVSSWILTTESELRQNIVSKLWQNTGRGYQLFVNDDFDWTDNYFIFMLWPDPLVSDTGVKVITYSPVVTDGMWHHVVGTYDGTTAKAYVDGILRRSISYSLGIYYHEGWLRIGKGNPDAYFNGAIDEVRIYNRALTEEEILSLAQYIPPLLIPSTWSKLLIPLEVPFSHEFPASGGDPPYSFTIANGTLPPGLVLSPDGVLSGTPTSDGDFTFTVQVTDENNDTEEREFTLGVLPTVPPPDIRITQTGTTAVPGRKLEYFVVVENVGDTVATNPELSVILPPYFTFLSSNPSPFEVVQAEDYFPDYTPGNTYDREIKLSIPQLDPGETETISYEAQLDPSFPLDEPVTGTACVIEEAEECRDELLLCYMVEAYKCTLLHPAHILKCVIYEATLVCQYKYVDCMIDLGQTCDMSLWQAVQPVDPNEKLVDAQTFVDPDGITLRAYIQPDETLVYPIHFENISDEVEAIDVFVTDVLDPNLDASTLEILTPDGASYDPGTRTLQWDLLGRNLQPHETDNVLFSIKPVPGLPSGTEIPNSATIQFEIFDPITTNQVINVIDTSPPSCVMDELPEETPAGDFDISWTGTDEIGEIDTYTIAVSTNGGSYSLFLENTFETTATFTGQAGSTYEFVCIATDTAGNMEVQEGVGEAVTTIPPGGICTPASARASSVYGSQLPKKVSVWSLLPVAFLPIGLATFLMVWRRKR